MARPYIEHVNISVSNPEEAAATLAAIFDWRIRWSGPSQMGGRTIHVGDDDVYIAVYTHDGERLAHKKGAPLNHIALVVDDLSAIEARVRAAGLEPFGHGDYAPGRRFYFFDRDGIEYEIVSYASRA